MPAAVEGRLVPIGDTRLHVVERGSGYPLIVLHGGPGMDHRMFGDYLDPLTDAVRLLLVDQRAQGRSERPPEETWTLTQMAADVDALARSLELDRYGVLGHSYGAFVALQNAVDSPGAAERTIVSSGLPSARFLAELDATLAAFEPVELRERVTQSWEREKHVRSEDEVAELSHDQLPFHFRDFDLIPEYERRTTGAAYSPDVLRRFANEEYGGIEVEDRLGEIPQPVLVLAGRYDRTCPVAGAEAIAAGIPNAELVVFEHSGHMTFVEENERYVQVVRAFLARSR
jgi:pimeloyl-ACP methyl ester carboxylesterase